MCDVVTDDLWIYGTDIENFIINRNPRYYFETVARMLYLKASFKVFYHPKNLVRRTYGRTPVAEELSYK